MQEIVFCTQFGLNTIDFFLSLGAQLAQSKIGGFGLPRVASSTAGAFRGKSTLLGEIFNPSTKVDID